MENKHNEKCGLELNHQGECVFPPQEPIICTFNQTTKFTSLIPPHNEHFEQIQCENITEEQFDEYGRSYCKEHRKKVDEINKSRHKNYISKQKLKNKIIEIKYEGFSNSREASFYSGRHAVAVELLELLESGYFDDDK